MSSRFPWVSSRLFWLCLLSAIAVVLIAWTELPLGIPGEWTWVRAAVEADLVLNVLLLGLAAGVFAAFVRIGEAGIETASPRGLSLRLAGLLLLTFGWLWAAQESAPMGFRLSKPAFILYYSGSSGYFTEASERAVDVRSYLAGYEARMAEGDVLHLGTHPPGLILAYRGLIELCSSSPALVNLLNATQPESAREAFAVIAEATQRSARPFPREDAAVLWLAAMLTQFAAAATVLPLYALLRRTESRLVSWRAVCFWPFVPALAVFLPKSDVLYPLIGVTLLYCWLEAVRRRSWWLALAAGFVGWLGLFLSLALLPVGALALLLSGFELWRERRNRNVGGAADAPSGNAREGWLPLAGIVLCGAAGLLIPVFVLWMVADLNLFRVWAWNLTNHAGFYDQFPRTYWKWLLVSPIEFAIAAGVPLLVLAGVTLRRAIHEPWSRQAGVMWSVLLTLGLLWLSGKNSGELARLWILFMPWMIWLAAPALDGVPKLSAQGKVGQAPLVPCSADRFWWAWGLHVAVSIVIVTRVIGFHVPG